MKGRGRAIGFALGALVCAAISASLAGGRTPAEAELAQLRDVVVTTTAIGRGTVLGDSGKPDGLTERRVPASFAPPDALASIDQGVGRKLALALPPGSYLTASSLTTTADTRPRRAPVPGGTTPIEIEVTGAGTLARAAGRAAVDVVVAGEPGPGPGAGRTYIAARSVRLLALSKAPAETGLPGERFIATLALTRPQALALIRAEGVARSIRLLGR